MKSKRVFFVAQVGVNEENQGKARDFFPMNSNIDIQHIPKLKPEIHVV